MSGPEPNCQCDENSQKTQTMIDILSTNLKNTIHQHPNWAIFLDPILQGKKKKIDETNIPPSQFLHLPKTFLHRFEKLEPFQRLAMGPQKIGECDR